MSFQKKNFKSVFLVIDRNYWEDCQHLCNRESDLVLVSDFGLKHTLQGSGYFVEYMDCLLPKENLNTLNFEMHAFLNSWYKDDQDNDLLNFEGHSIGDALLLDVINDITNFCHFFVNFVELKTFQYETLFAALDDELVTILTKTNIPFTLIGNKGGNKYSSYRFPVTQWMKANVKPDGVRRKMKNIVACILDMIALLRDNVFLRSRDKVIYIHTYYSTMPIIQKIVDSTSWIVVTENYRKGVDFFYQHRVFYKSWRSSASIAAAITNNFSKSSKRTWMYGDYPLGSLIHDYIQETIRRETTSIINDILSIRKYFLKRKLKLMVPISNLSSRNRLIMQYCFQNNIPVFMILNGFQSLSFWNDGKDSNWVNCYSQSIKEDHFNNSANALPLGDPRMDVYAELPQKEIDRNKPVILIGTSGYSSLDLNSYLSVEFEFIYSVFEVLQEIQAEGREFSVIVKVRSNGYADKYVQLLGEYFPSIAVSVEQRKDFKSVLVLSDLYLSFYSQTILEASSLGIPAIYFKNDKQDLFRPFDGKSELVTAFTGSELKEKIDSFFNDGAEFKLFQQKHVLENYIGPIDGGNVERNLNFIKYLMADNVPA